MLYALLDGSPVIQPEHLGAAAALWESAERSADSLFSRQSATPLAERIEAALRQYGPLYRRQLYDLVGHQVAGAALTSALEALEQQGRIIREPDQAAHPGRWREVWRLA